MRPFSSPSEPPPREPSPGEPAGLFDGILARGGVRAEVADRAWLRAMLDVEAALARCEAAAGVIPPDAAAAIERACRAIDASPSASGALPAPSALAAALSTEAAASGNPVVPLVERLRKAVPAEAASFVHKGATSQDILDSAAMLVAFRALGPLLDDLQGAADAAALLAQRHRDTAMAGRTLLQQAMPTTFGLKAAGWMVGLDEAVTRLQTVRATRLSAQFGGAAGTLAGLGDAGPEVALRLAEELGLAAAVLPWHTNRTRPAELAGALGEAAGVVGKAALDVTLLAQNEVSEVSEGSPGGSSAMAHKRNPVAAISARACAAQAPGLVATVLASMAHEHERAAGAWHAEWRPQRDLLVSTGSAASWLRDCLRHLEVDADAMATNLAHLLRRLSVPDRAAPDQAASDVGSAGALVDRALAGRR